MPGYVRSRRVRTATGASCASLSSPVPTTWAYSRSSRSGIRWRARRSRHTTTSCGSRTVTRASDSSVTSIGATSEVTTGVAVRLDHFDTVLEHMRGRLEAGSTPPTAPEQSRAVRRSVSTSQRARNVAPMHSVSCSRRPLWLRLSFELEQEDGDPGTLVGITLETPGVFAGLVELD